MKNSAYISISLLVFLLATAFTPARWDFLGKRRINRNIDRDEISVTRAEGTFNALKFKVRNAPVTLYDMKVHYGNGSVEDLKLRIHIPAGGESRYIDLKGGNRVIRKVVFRYETKTRVGKRAQLMLFGKR